MALVEMVVDSIRVSLLNGQRVLILKEKYADRYLPIWIGPHEADAIALELQQIQVPRPLTHDLLKNIIHELGATVSSVIVNDLNNETFYARILMDVGGRQIEVDSRPSDAIALAVRVKAPIYADESVMERAGVTLEEEAPKSEREKPPKAEEKVELPPIFQEFLKTLDLGDQEPGKS